ncbi:hypothetical protein [Nostoc sp. FACHB-888]|uniref:hypothetical protein n=1 Tax=Nostoc sp. FACHB-888 TaxID=2692842 RepID=UPI0016850EE3|nr:hypothetical protein [Nostoc sp. FACHB-888]MBD2247268.1 hypothetical protein [Nostoc sp. FACHB-888]MCC5653282.1 hypothetical protein [Nostoc sp. XA013]
MGIFASRFSGDAYGGLRLRIPSTKLNQQLEFREMRSHCQIPSPVNLPNLYTASIRLT